MLAFVKLQYDLINPPNTTHKPIIHAEMKKLAENQDFTIEELNAIRYNIQNMTKLMSGMGNLNVALYRHNRRLEAKMDNMSTYIQQLEQRLENKKLRNDTLVTSTNNKHRMHFIK